MGELSNYADDNTLYIYDRDLTNLKNNLINDLDTLNSLVLR